MWLSLSRCRSVPHLPATLKSFRGLYLGQIKRIGVVRERFTLVSGKKTMDVITFVFVTDQWNCAVGAISYLTLMIFGTWRVIYDVTVGYLVTVLDQPRTGEMQFVSFIDIIRIRANILVVPQRPSTVWPYSPAMPVYQMLRATCNSLGSLYDLVPYIRCKRPAVFVHRT